jgi:hypothetical protein
MIENWIPAMPTTLKPGFQIPLPLSTESLRSVYNKIQDVGKRLWDEVQKDKDNSSQSGRAFMTHVKAFTMLFWYEVMSLYPRFVCGRVT